MANSRNPHAHYRRTSEHNCRARNCPGGASFRAGTSGGLREEGEKNKFERDSEDQAKAMEGRLKPSGVFKNKVQSLGAFSGLKSDRPHVEKAKVWGGQKHRAFPRVWLLLGIYLIETKNNTL
jgi:hypothetical protein